MPSSQLSMVGFAIQSIMGASRLKSSNQSLQKCAMHSRRSQQGTRCCRRAIGCCACAQISCTSIEIKSCVTHSSTSGISFESQLQSRPYAESWYRGIQITLVSRTLRGTALAVSLSARICIAPQQFFEFHSARRSRTTWSRSKTEAGASQTQTWSSRVFSSYG